jgi:hypothetical protein
MLESALPSGDRNELICMEGDGRLEVFREVIQVRDKPQFLSRTGPDF